MTAWNVDATTSVDGGVKVVTEQGAAVVIRMKTDPDGLPVLVLEPEAGVSLEGDEPGVYYVLPA